MIDIYLSCPYSDPDPKVRECRFNTVNDFAAVLFRAGLSVFSPISHTHPIAEAGCLPVDFAFWKDCDLAFIELCRTLVVLQLPGWGLSHGVYCEIEIAAELGKPLMYARTSTTPHEIREWIKSVSDVCANGGDAW